MSTTTLGLDVTRTLWSFVVSTEGFRLSASPYSSLKGVRQEVGEGGLAVDLIRIVDYALPAVMDRPSAFSGETSRLGDSRPLVIHGCFESTTYKIALPDFLPDSFRPGETKPGKISAS